MRIASRAWVFPLILAAPVALTQAPVVELEPDVWSGRGALNLHGWLRSEERISSARLVLEFDASRVHEVRVRIPDALKAPDLVTQASLTSTGAEIVVRYGGSGAPTPAPGTSTKAFMIRVCFEEPTPFAGWAFPVEVPSCELTVVGSETPVSVSVPMDPITIPWGTSWCPCQDEPEPPEFVTCVTQPDGQVLITWRNPESYDSIEIHHGQNGQVFLPGDATSWLHAAGGAGTNYTYEIKGHISAGEGERGNWSDIITCSAEDPRPPVSFIRGDANMDGILSTADMISIQRWAFTGEDAPTCIDAMDITDDGDVSGADILAVAYYLFGMQFGTNGGPFDGGAQPPAPFPEPGPDPTHFGESWYLSCDAYEITPPENTEDAIRIGDVEAGSGSEVLVPVYLTNSVPVDAVQLVVRYDPSVLRIASGRETLVYEGTYYEQFAGRWFTVNHGASSSSFLYDRPWITQVDAHPDDGVFTASIVSHIFFAEVFQIPPGEDTIVAKIRMEVSPDVPAGTTLHLDPDAGPEGYGPFALHNELTYKGDGRYATIHPREVGGILRIGVDGDISFFRRGDANGDEQLDISDAVSVLGYLFLGTEVSCEDAADADDSGDLLITDGIVILMHLFGGTETIPPPYPEPGLDPNPDFLGGCRAAN